MSRVYTFEDIIKTTRTLSALVPEGVKVNTTLGHGNFAMSVTLCGRDGVCFTYDYGPGFTSYHLLRIAEQWETGERVDVPTTFDPMVAAAEARFIEGRDDFVKWVRDAKKGNRVVYFRGELAQFRADAPKRRVQLETKMDHDTPGGTLGTHERLEYEKLRRTIDLLEAVQQLHTAHVIEMVQLRMSDGTGTTYYAAKR